MTLSELLDYVRIDLLRDKSDLVSGSTDRLFSDELIVRYLDEAQKLFCRRTYALVDNSSDLAEISISEDEPEYELDPLILFVYSARISTESYPLADLTFGYIPTYSTDCTGLPTAYSLDEANRIIRFYPIPDASYTVKLRIARLPSADLTLDDLDASPEIDAQYHLDLGDFAAYRCLQNNDIDGSDKGTADVLRKEWEMKVREAKREFYRYRLGATPVAVRSWTYK